jgi:hypothetical protein
MQTLIQTLLDPPEADIDQRIQEYDFYTRYATDDLSSTALGEEKDLQVYMRAARLAEGEGVEELLKGDAGFGWVEKEKDDFGRANLQFYENWLRT